MVLLKTENFEYGPMSSQQLMLGWGPLFYHKYHRSSLFRLRKRVSSEYKGLSTRFRFIMYTVMSLIRKFSLVAHPATYSVSKSLLHHTKNLILKKVSLRLISIFALIKIINDSVIYFLTCI